ncbi:hypothetical protein FQZ97_1005070 [compost metagenome]
MLLLAGAGVACVWANADEIARVARATVATSLFIFTVILSKGFLCSWAEVSSIRSVSQLIRPGDEAFATASL